MTPTAVLASSLPYRCIQVGDRFRWQADSLERTIARIDDSGSLVNMTVELRFTHRSRVLEWLHMRWDLNRQDARDGLLPRDLALPLALPMLVTATYAFGQLLAGR